MRTELMQEQRGFRSPATQGPSSGSPSRNGWRRLFALCALVLVAQAAVVLHVHGDGEPAECWLTNCIPIPNDPESITRCTPEMIINVIIGDGDASFGFDNAWTLEDPDNCGVILEKNSGGDSATLRIKPNAKLKTSKVTVKCTTSWDCIYSGGEGNPAVRFHGEDQVAKVVIHVEGEDDDDDGNSCSSCGGASGQNKIGSGTVMNQGVDFRLNLGKSSRTVSGGSRKAGYMGFKTNTIPVALASSLNIPYASTVERYPVDESLPIQQVKAPEGLVVVGSVSYGYTMTVYDESQLQPGQTSVPYSLKGDATPLVVWTVRNPDGNSSLLQVIENREGVEKTWLYSLVSGGLRLDRPDTSYTISQTQSLSDGYTETRELRNTDGSLARKTQKTYKNIASLSDPLLTQVLEGDGSVTRSTTYTYYPDDASPEANLLRRIDYSDGNWTYYIYDSGRKSIEYSAYNNSPAPAAGTVPDPDALHCRRVEYVYVTEHPYPSTTTTTFLPVHNPDDDTWSMVSVSSQTRASSYDSDGFLYQTTMTDAESLTTTMTYINDKEDPDLGAVRSIRRPDRTMSLFSYLPASLNGDKVIIEESGECQGGAIQSGTQTETKTDRLGRLLYRITRAIQGGVANIVTSRVAYLYTTGSSDYSMTDELTLRTTTYFHDCCGLASVTDPDGVVRKYDNDPLHRQVASEILRGSSTGVKLTNILDVAGRVLFTKRIPAGGTVADAITLEKTSYDILGCPTLRTNALGGITTYLYQVNNNGGRRDVTIFPDGGKLTNDYNLDGQLARTTGSASTPVQYEYGVASFVSQYREYTTVTKLDAAWNPTPEWTRTFVDGDGRTLAVVYSPRPEDDPNDPPSSRSFYNSKGQLWKQVDPDTNTTLFVYDNKGQREYSITAVQASTKAMASYDDLVYGLEALKSDTSIDRITTNLVMVAESTEGGKPARNLVEKYVWTDGSSTPRLISRSESAVSGLQSWQTVWRTSGNDATKAETMSVTTYGPANGRRTQTTTEPDNTTTVSVYSYGQITSVTRFDSAGQPVSLNTYSYDNQGRQWQVADDRNGTTTYAYNNADQIVSVTTPAPAPGKLPLVTSTAYNNMGRVISVTQPDGTVVSNSYFANGQLQKTFGSRTYPVEYTYDAQGRMKTMKTWKDFNETTGNGASGYAITTWNYDANRGWLASKDYPNASTGNAPAIGTGGPNYTYTPGGRLKTRVWQRADSNGNKVTTEYKYGFNDDESDNKSGDLTKVEYSNEQTGVVTPAVTYTYDRMGRRKTAVVEPTLLQTGFTTTYDYNDAGQVLTETMSGGIMNGISVSRSYNNSLRMDGLNVLNGTTTTYDADYAYDTAGRLQTVINGDNSATYAYHDKSSLIHTLTFNNGTTPPTTRMRTTRNYDFVNRLTGISSVSYPTTPPTAPATLNSSSYQLNSASQRVRNDLSDGSYWEYSYDTMGQVVSGKRYWQDGTPVAGQQYEYAYDDIGNRTGAKMGGDNSGASLRSATYTSDRLNRYSSRTVPAYADIVGIANPTAPVNVTANGATQAATRKGEYFWKAVSTPNNNTQTHAPWYDQITINSTYGSGQSDAGYLFVPYSPEAFLYDLDGNLTNDGRWVFTWDAENRLVKMEPISTVPDAAKMKLEFAYDHQSRRIEKKVTTWVTGTPGSWSTTPTITRYVYDGWNLLGIYNSAFSLQTSFIWGLDLSGTMQGAGGVGGLLWATDSSDSHYAAYDGNGNITALTKASDGTESARYEYGPFGEVIRMTGTYARSNPFRFSTKFTDDESGLLYYGYRYYNPSTGRWLSRDPIEEKGGRNLYGFVWNNSIWYSDSFGLDAVGDWISGIYWNAWWWNIPFLSDGPGLQTRDDGTMNTMGQRLVGQMDLFYFKLAKEESLKGGSSSWKTVQIVEGATGEEWAIARRDGIDFSDAGFWLNRANPGVNTLAGGSFEMRVCSNKIEIRNTMGKFRWFDRIDNNPNRNDGFWFWLLESVNQIPEWLTNAAFDVQIDWQDDRKDVREVE
jgi:RHS repeat-associated protein